jgi:DNA-directed RNA polymerase subunit omega
MSQKISDEFDSKFRFILVAAERAKQIQNGAPPLLDLKSRKPAFVAIKETQADLVQWTMLEEDEQIEEEEEK